MKRTISDLSTKAKRLDIGIFLFVYNVVNNELIKTRFTTHIVFYFCDFTQF